MRVRDCHFLVCNYYAVEFSRILVIPGNSMCTRFQKYVVSKDTLSKMVVDDTYAIFAADAIINFRNGGNVLACTTKLIDLDEIPDEIYEIEEHPLELEDWK